MKNNNKITYDNSNYKPKYKPNIMTYSTHYEKNHNVDVPKSRNYYGSSVTSTFHKIAEQRRQEIDVVDDHYYFLRSLQQDMRFAMEPRDFW